MEWHVKFKGTRAPWPVSRLSCSRPLHGRMHLQRAICIDWLQFQLGKSDVTFSQVTKTSRRVEQKRKSREKKGERKSEQDKRNLPYPIVNNTMELTILRRMGLFLYWCKIDKSTSKNTMEERGEGYAVKIFLRDI